MVEIIMNFVKKEQIENGVFLSTTTINIFFFNGQFFFNIVRKPDYVVWLFKNFFRFIIPWPESKLKRTIKISKRRK